MDITILICTFNRADSLRLTLENLCGMDAPGGVRWELLVIDNNSDDHTARVCGDFAKKLPMRYIRETEQGLAAARNRGIAEAGGSLLAFTDDDVDVDRAWMAELWRAGGVHPEASFFGGKVVPLWKEDPPAWMAEYSRRMLAGITMDFTLGEEEMLVEGEGFFFGANMAFRREALQKMGPFRADLGMKAGSLGFHEETEYMKRLLGAGYRGLYVPGMVVHHRNGPQRMTEGYLLRWFVGSGRSDVRMGDIWPQGRNLFGAPRYLWRRLFENGFSYLSRRWDATAGAEWVPAAVRMAAAWGAILEFRRMGMERGCDARRSNH